MSGTCHCGHALDHGFDALGCLGCGQVCCSKCSYAPEAAVYCAICNAAFFGLAIPGGLSLGPAVGVQEGRREPVRPEGVASGPKT